MKQFARDLPHVIALAAILDKLFKVIQHSDPTAAAKKKLLYDKYQSRLAKFAGHLLGQVEWNSFKTWLMGLNHHYEYQRQIQAQMVVINKLIKDLEPFFIQDQKLPEFTKPSPTEMKARREQEERITQAKRKRERERQQKAMRDEEMVLRVAGDPRQQEAAGKLKAVIDALNRIGPDALENQINKHLKEQKK